MLNNIPTLDYTLVHSFYFFSFFHLFACSFVHYSFIHPFNHLLYIKCPFFILYSHLVNIYFDAILQIFFRATEKVEFRYVQILKIYHILLPYIVMGVNFKKKLLFTVAQAQRPPSNTLNSVIKTTLDLRPSTREIQAKEVRVFHTALH